MVERVNDFRQKQLARLEKTLEQYVTASQDAGTISNSRNYIYSLHIEIRRQFLRNRRRPR